MSIDINKVLCPSCGYYCLGNGGVGCIDKPSLLPDGKTEEKLNDEFSKAEEKTNELIRELEGVRLKRPYDANQEELKQLRELARMLANDPNFTNPITRYQECVNEYLDDLGYLDEV